MTVSFWESNRNQPCLAMVLGITAFLGYSPHTKARAEENLGERLTRRRRALGIQQKDLAQEIKVDPTTRARWERG